MQRQDQPIEGHSDNNTQKSCPTILEEDVTRSLNQQIFRNARSQQFLPNSELNHHQEPNLNIRGQIIEALKNSSLVDKPPQQSKIDVKIINKKGTDFDCQKVQSIELSIQELSHRSGSLKNRSNRNSQPQISEPHSGKKSKKQQIQKSKPQQSYRHNDIKQEVLNVLVAGAEDTGKSIFVSCFKGKYRKNNEPYIKPQTKEIKYKRIKVDQNLLNKRNAINFIDLAGFAPNQEEKYLRQIQQYAIAQWRHFREKSEEDRRIHCCLYFMRGPRIKNSDINVMKKLSSLFNLIPIISKSDNYTKAQILQMKEQFHRKIEAAGLIDLYNLKQFYLLTHGTDKIKEALQSAFGEFPPFAITCSSQKQNPQSHNFVRNYPWGKVEIQNEEHSDFQKLCDILSIDIRGQLLNKLIPLPQAKEPTEIIFEQIIEEQIGVLGNVIREGENNNSNLSENVKKLLITGSLIAIGAFLFVFKLKLINTKDAVQVRHKITSG